MDEIWADIPGYDGIYKISNLGDIKSFFFKNPKILHKTKNIKCGYYYVGLYKDGKLKVRTVHGLVAESFLGDRNGLEINHKDLDKSNNRADNLEYCSHKDNIRHAIGKGAKIGRKSGCTGVKGELNHFSKLTTKDVMEIRELYSTNRYRQIDLASKYSITASTISSVVNYDTWTDIKNVV